MRTPRGIVAPGLIIAAVAGSPVTPPQTHPLTHDVLPAPTSPGGAERPSLGVRGIVVDSQGTPIRGATVRVLLGTQSGAPGDPPSVRTGTTGAFEIRGLSQWPQTVEVTHPDFSPAFARISPVGSPPAPSPLRLQMSAGGRVEGVALQKHGTPMGGLRVEVRAGGDGNVPMPNLGTTTREDGSFSLDHVPIGPLAEVTLQSPRGGYLMEAARTPAGSLPIVREGKVTTVSFPPYLVRVQGRLTRAGTPLAKAVVRQAQGGYAYQPSPRKDSFDDKNGGATDEEGRFVTFLRPGPQRVMVASLDGRRLFGQLTMLVPDADDPEIEVAIAGGQTVSGQVVDRATRKGISGAMLDVRRRSKMSESTRLSLLNQGRFSIDLEADDYVVGVTAQHYQPTQITLGVYGSALAPLSLELSPSLQIAGRVVGCDEDETGPRYCTVSIRSLDGREPSEIGVEPDGTFRLDVLEQKPYNLCAGSDKAGWAVLTGVQAGTADVILTIQPAGRLALIIRGPDGRPVPGTLPVVRSVEAGLIGFSTAKQLSDASGRLEFEVPAGDVEIDLRSQRYKGRLRVQVSAGVTSIHEVTLTESSALP